MCTSIYIFTLIKSEVNCSYHEFFSTRMKTIKQMKSDINLGIYFLVVVF